MAGLDALVGGESRPFCCLGCRAVAEAIAQGGLGEYYSYRDQESSKPSAVDGDFSLFDQSDVQAEFVTDQAGGGRQARLFVGGITCAACVWLIEGYLNKVPGVRATSVNASSHQALVSYDPQQVELSSIFQHLARIGFAAQPLIAQAQRDAWLKQRKEDLLRLGVAGIGMMQAGMVSIGLHAGDIQGIEPVWQNLLRWVCLVLTLPVLLYSAQPFFIASWRALRTRHLVMDVPVALALVLAFCASVVATVTASGDVYFDSVAMFTFFLLLGRYLEKQARLRNLLASVRQLQLLPLTVQVQDDMGLRTVPLRQLVVGDQVRVAAGATFPCDGVLIEGHTEVVEALITGESLPVEKAAGDSVIGGSVNGSAPVLIRATAVGADTRVAAIEALSEQGEMLRPRQVAMADRLAAKFVARVLIVAVAAFLFWQWRDPGRALWVTLSVLVVTCPCALSLATPAVLTAAINRLRSYGVLIVNAQSLEVLARIDRVVFDKTGTLTEGRLQLTEVMALADMDRAEALAVAAALEEGSSHPIARAFTPFTDSAPKVIDREVVLGQGVAGRIDGQLMRLGTPEFAAPGQADLPYPSAGLWLLLSRNGEPCTWIRLEDRVRSEAAEAVAELTALGVSVSLLSGDRQANVADVAASLNIGDRHGSLLPEQKLEKVKAMQAAGERILMVGDGINDVPVLALADASCAMASATDLAQTRADAVLLGDNLLHLPELLRTARRVRRITRQNLIWALAYNFTALPFAVLGWVPPWLAAAGMSASSLVVVLNALRLGSRARQKSATASEHTA